MCKHFAKPEVAEKLEKEELDSQELESLGLEAHELEAQKKPGIPLWLDIALMVAGTLLLALCIRTFIAETFEVPTGSMLDTIQLGDRLVCEKVTLHWSSPKQGDIVTFADPDGSGVTLIKRVIATEGQVVDLQGGFVFVDGVKLDEEYTEERPSFPLDGHAPNLTEDVSYPYTVPAGHVWVMGDNRTNSLDSRYFGAVPVSSITSKAVYIYWPISDARAV